MKNPHASAESRARWESAYLETRRGQLLRRWRLERLVDADKAGILVDLGSGDGLNLGILRNLGFERVIALDYSAELLRHSAWTPSVAGDAHRLPFRDDSVATVFADSVLHHLSDYERVAREIVRILKPGGRLYYMEPRPGLARTLLDKLTFAPLVSRLSFFAARRVTLLEEWDLHYHWLRHHEEMERWLESRQMRCRYRRRGPIGIFLSFEKPTVR